MEKMLVLNKPAVEIDGWVQSDPARQLLYVISSIIAQEYVQIAKQNPGIFKESGVNK